jgi:hypothetical protein
MDNKIVSTVVIIVKFCLAFIACRGRGLKENVTLMWFDLGNSRQLSLREGAIVPRGRIGRLLPLTITNLSPLS